MIDEEEKREFEERADFIDEKDLISWTVDNEFYDSVQSKIFEKGAKLIVGPRGTGKTHQFKLAYIKCLESNDKPLALYITFGKYYHLEPLLYKSANAIKIFHSWILAKICLECFHLINRFKLSITDFFDIDNYNEDILKNFIEMAERNNIEQENELIINSLSIQKIIDLIEKIAAKLNRKRTILLLDDAALTLTPDYLVEFFDVFRSLKTQYISPKASVYPGTTQYGPRFHIGQDAEEVSAWFNVEESNYSTFMENLIEKRFVNNKFNNKEISELIKYSSFGIPRAFITLLRNFQQDKGKTLQQKFNSTINQQRDLLRKEYSSLSLKLPTYKSIINTGLDFFDEIIKITVEANRENPHEKKIYFGLLVEEKTNKSSRMIKFLIEAGLLFELTPINDGPDRIFNRYIPHFLFLIQARAFSHTKGFNPKKTLNYIQKKSDKRPIRKQISTILSKQQIEKIKLNLPPCKKCGTERLTEEQKFCHSCGSPLLGYSSFEKILSYKIEELPVPEWQIKNILEQTDIKTIQDIIMSQSPAAELKKARGIGNVRSKKIYEIVNNLLDEFMS